VKRITLTPLLAVAILLGVAAVWLHSVRRLADSEGPVLHDTQRSFDPLPARPGHTRPPESPAAEELRTTSERAARGTILLSK